MAVQNSDSTASPSSALSTARRLALPVGWLISALIGFSCNADKLSRCAQIIDKEDRSLQTLARSYSEHISVSPAPGANKAEKMSFIEIKFFNLINQITYASNINNQEKLVVADFPAANGE